MRQIITSCRKYPRLFSFTFGIGLGLVGIFFIWGPLSKTGISVYILILLQYLLWVGIVLTITSILRISKWWSLLGFLGWIIIDIILSNQKKESKTGAKSPSTGIQLLGMLGFLGFGLHAIFNTSIVTGTIAVLILLFIIWYTKKHK